MPGEVHLLQLSAARAIHIVTMGQMCRSSDATSLSLCAPEQRKKQTQCWVSLLSASFFS
jgi:hypothetical protein